ncbi:YidH family protein [Bacillus paranthracis]
MKYAQQHLANERTYLAWIRTAISITGVGFLTTSLHFTIKLSSNPYINILVIVLGIFACVIGFITGVLSTIQYSKKEEKSRLVSLFHLITQLFLYLFCFPC